MEKAKIKELADAYAVGKVEKILSNAIADAYAEGFMAGYKAYEERLLDMPTDENGFVNLGLPSGTLWADDFVMDKDGRVLILPYRKAIDYSIPSEEQWRELMTECRFIHNHERIDNEGSWTYYYHCWIECIGPNGNKIIFDCIHCEDEDGRLNCLSSAFWLQNGMIASYNNSDSNVEISTAFPGYKKGIRLVRKHKS